MVHVTEMRAIKVIDIDAMGMLKQTSLHDILN